MSSINSYPTLHYSQPAEYKLSHDSVFLARWVYENVSVPKETWTALDLCAGSGVVGLDFLFHLCADGKVLPAQLDFLEIQSIYLEHFQKNWQTLSEVYPEARKVSHEFLLQNYNLPLVPNRKYDLILANPPYFKPTQGKLSPSEFKNRCRFFIDGSFAEMLGFIETQLATSGDAYLLLRSLKDHGYDTVAEAQSLLQQRQLEVVTNIRGTDVVRIF